jgi:hypothetical protein
MIAVKRTIELFTCPGCGLRYRGVKEPFPFARAGPVRLHRLHRRGPCMVQQLRLHGVEGQQRLQVHPRFSVVLLLFTANLAE